MKDNLLLLVATTIFSLLVACSSNAPDSQSLAGEQPGGDVGTVPPSEPDGGTIIACTQIGCVDGLSVGLEHEWTAGSYTFEITLDGITTYCQATLPFASCEVEPACPSNSDIMVSLSGCALPAENHSFAEVSTTRFDFSQMKVKILLGSTTISEKTFTPEFRTTQPNGPQCEPTCHQAPRETWAF
jgi:hypothetical protein